MMRSYLQASFGRVRLLALSCCLLGTSLPTGRFAFSSCHSAFDVDSESFFMGNNE